MFTGIVTDIGTVERIVPLNEGIRLRVATNDDPATIAIGASISHAGVCLTVTALPQPGSNERWHEVEAWEEALRLTTIGTWQEGARVNLERALKIGDELGGHIVSGHVDAVGHIADWQPEGASTRLTVRAPAELAPFIAPKGSIAVDGVSLTVNEVLDRADGSVDFGLNLIPHTSEVTTLGELAQGAEVNLEIDTVARYLRRLESLRT